MGIFNTTIDGNTAQSGGGGALIEAGGTLLTSTISNNVSTGGASGIAFLGLQQAMSGVYASTIAGNFESKLQNVSHGTDVVLAGDHNLINASWLTLPADTISNNPLPGPLQDNGGPIWTRLPTINAGAFERGNANGHEFDHHGLPRITGAAADVGAVELQLDGIFANGFEACSGRYPLP